MSHIMLKLYVPALLSPPQLCKVGIVNPTLEVRKLSDQIYIDYPSPATMKVQYQFSTKRFILQVKPANSLVGTNLN